MSRFEKLQLQFMITVLNFLIIILRSCVGIPGYYTSKWGKQEALEEQISGEKQVREFMTSVKNAIKNDHL